MNEPAAPTLAALGERSQWQFKARALAVKCLSRQIAQLSIDHPFNHPQHIPLVADWIYGEFWADKPGYSAAFFEGLLRQATDLSTIPLSLVAIAGDHPAGTINLIANDDPERPHLAPWLAALVVILSHWGQGIGTRLVQTLQNHARRLGYGHVFLGTDQPHFYRRLGAESYEQASDTLEIMCLPTSPLPLVQHPQ